MYINAHGAPNKLSLGNSTNYAKLKKANSVKSRDIWYLSSYSMYEAYNRHEYEILNTTKKHRNSLYFFNYIFEMRDIYSSFFCNLQTKGEKLKVRNPCVFQKYDIFHQ